jgi:thiol-disulfide isomerase/thioredoxin
MKYFALFLSVAVIMISGCRSSKTAKSAAAATTVTQAPATDYAATEKKFSDQSTWLLGYFNGAQLKQEPYSEWFYRGYDSYQPKPDVVEKLRGIITGDITVKIVMGTWCPDSRREVPRFMRIMSVLNFPDGKITFIGVDNSKLSPVGEYSSLSIQRVPTFIFLRKNVEAGRIIENPVTSLEQDMLNILTKDGK